MCKFKELKPNLKVIVLFLDNQKAALDFQEKLQKSTTEIKNKFTVPELGKELYIDQSHIRKYLKELENKGLINTFKSKGKIEVIL